MMNSFQYLLQVNIYILLFYGFYSLLLRNETYFRLNRVYLLGSAVLSFLIPLLRSDWIQSLFVTQQIKQAADAFTGVLYQTAPQIAAPVVTETWGITHWITAIYLAGTAFSVGRFLWSLAIVYFSSADGSQNQAYSFFKRVVVSDAISGRETIVSHEQVHSRQWHSVDVLFFELVTVINWFNPVIYFYKKTVKQIHEFIADEEAAKHQPSKSDYAVLLVSSAFGVAPGRLSNSFYSQSLLKKRIIMLHKTKSRKAALLKYGLSAPLFAGMLVFSSASIPYSAPLKELTETIEGAPANLFSQDDPNTVRGDKAFLERNPSVSRVNWSPNPFRINIYLRNGKVERYLLDKTSSSKEAEAKYGKLPVPPPPPPAEPVKTTPQPGKQAKETADLPATDPSNERVSGPNIPMTEEIRAIEEPSLVQDDLIHDFATIEKAPEFPGGQKAFSAYIARTYKYPEEAVKAGVKGRVIVQFIVEKDGSLTGLKVVRDIGSGTGEEVMRVLQQMPHWSPGLANGKPVRVAFTLPLALEFAKGGTKP